MRKRQSRRLGDRRRRMRAEDGVAAVEFAIMLPVLLLFVVGMLEFGFVMRDWLTVSGAARDGARAATNGAANGCYTGSGATCVPVLAQTAADSVEKAVIGMPKSAVRNIWVYKANSSGYPGSATTQAAADTAGCSTDCIVYSWSASANSGAGGFIRTAGTWDSSRINACLPNPDQVGVILRTDHPYMTRMFGATIALNDRAFMRFQPLPVAICNGSGSPSTGGHG